MFKYLTTENIYCKRDKLEFGCMFDRLNEAEMKTRRKSVLIGEGAGESKGLCSKSEDLNSKKNLI